MCLNFPTYLIGLEEEEVLYPSENPNKVHPWHFANVCFQFLLNDKFTLLLFFFLMVIFCRNR